MLTHTSAEERLQVVGYGDCQMTVLAVGGGGRGGYYYESYAAGGGSGFLSFYSQPLTPGVTDLTVSVGAQGDSSSIDMMKR